VLLLLLPQQPPLLQSRQPGQPRRRSPSKVDAGLSRAEGERGAAVQGQLAGLRGRAEERRRSPVGDGRPRVAVTGRGRLDRRPRAAVMA
jgi:hypothetical protein